MKNISRVLATVACVSLLGVGCGDASSSPSTSASGLVDIGAGIEGVSGLHATVFATGLTHAATFAFDAQGRLWVATADYTDSGQDGVYLVTKAGAQPIEMISGLHTPLGLLWDKDVLYVASKARVDAFTNLRGTKFTTRRTVVALPADVGEVNTIALAPGGRLLVGITAPCDHCTPASRYSGAIIAVRTDGTGLTVYASGIRAPVGLAFFPGTSDLFVTMDYRDDLGSKTPGDEHAAVSDVAIVTGQLGSKVGTSALVAEWALGKVQRIALTKTGDTYTGAVTPFLSGIKNPVAISRATDGAVLVGDWTTGIVYRVDGS